MMKSATNSLALSLDNESQMEISRTDTGTMFPEVKITPSRFRNAIGKYRLLRNNLCVACGKCAEVCTYGVYMVRNKKMMRPADHLCIGFNCNKCVEVCPQHAISLKERPVELNKSDFSTKIPLNRLNDGRIGIEIDIPVYGGGMSYGSISLHTMIARARAWKAWHSFTSTGEGGYPEELEPYNDNVITQVATGLFGVREETIQRVKIVEFKYAQGAKPGLGGHLLGDKVTMNVARMREAVPGSSLFSAFPFHSVYSVEDHKKNIDWIKEINTDALISIKVSTPTDVDMVAVGSYYAGAHIIHIDGGSGGTAAATALA